MRATKYAFVRIAMQALLLLALFGPSWLFTSPVQASGIGEIQPFQSVPLIQQADYWEPQNDIARVNQRCPNMATNKSESSYPLGITVHHTVGDGGGDWFAASVGSHCSEDRPPYLIVIDKLGVAHLTAEFGSRTNHARCDGYGTVGKCPNTDYASIAVVGDYRYDELTAEQRRTLVLAIRWLVANGAHPKLLGHRDVGKLMGYGTVCPGENIYKLLPEIAEEAFNGTVVSSGSVINTVSVSTSSKTYAFTTAAYGEQYQYNELALIKKMMPEGYLLVRSGEEINCNKLFGNLSLNIANDPNGYYWLPNFRGAETPGAGACDVCSWLYYVTHEYGFDTRRTVSHPKIPDVPEEYSVSIWRFDHEDRDLMWEDFHGEQNAWMKNTIGVDVVIKWKYDEQTEDVLIWVESRSDNAAVITQASNESVDLSEKKKINFQLITLTDFQMGLWFYLMIFPPFLIVTMVGLSYFHYSVSSGHIAPRVKRKKVGQLGAVGKDEYRNQKIARRKHRIVQRMAFLSMVILAVSGVGYLGTIFLYQPVWPRGEVLLETLPDEYTPTEPPKTVITQEVTTDVVDIWVQIAQQADYKNPELLRQFCVEYNYPRGPDGKFLAVEEGGKLFPCEYAAGVTKGETNTEVWQNPNPMDEGPWGKSLGWNIATTYFPLSLQEVADGRSISKLAEGCRDGLKAIAQNSVVQAKYPGITAQNIYTSQGCAVGRGQTLALHFRPGGLLGDLENMDVWGSDGPAIEAIYRHLVSRGCNGNWYKTGSVENARCGYNPNSWGVPEHQWYWDAWANQAVSIRDAIDTHQGDLSNVGQSPLVTVHIPAEQVEILPEPIKEIVTIQTDRPTIGGGVFAQYDTLYSLTYRAVVYMIGESAQAGDDQSVEFYYALKSFMLQVAEHTYSQDSRYNLGLYEPETE